MGEVDLGGLLGQLLDLAASIIVSLLKGDEGVGGVALKTELGTDLGPVDLESCAALQCKTWSAFLLHWPSLGASSQL